MYTISDVSSLADVLPACWASFALDSSAAPPLAPLGDIRAKSALDSKKKTKEKDQETSSSAKVKVF